MTLGGWVLMVSCVGGAVAFFAWTLARVLSRPDAVEHIHSPADIETPDAVE